MSGKKISIVVPVYFNAESLPALFERLLALEESLAKLQLETELIFVDDGSGDASLERLKEFKARRPETKIIKHTRNFGAAQASKTGYRYVTGDAFLSIAADLQDPPELVIEMAKRWQAGSKFVICERVTRKDPLLTKLFSSLYYFLLRTLIIDSYPRGGYDMGLMDKAFQSYLVDSTKGVFIPLLAYWLGFKPDVITYDRPGREHGRSRWTFKKRYNAFLDVMLGFSVTPIRLISGIGVFVSMSSFIYGAVVVWAALHGRIPVQGYSTIVALITFLLGLIILMLGLIGEYLVRIFNEVNRRPGAVVEEVL